MTPNKLIAMAEKLEQAEQSRYVAKFSPVMKEAATMLRDLAGEMEGGSNWRDMKTAPRDGTYFLGLNNGDEVLVNWPHGHAIGEWSFYKGKWTGAARYTVSKWRPLPKGEA